MRKNPWEKIFNTTPNRRAVVEKLLDNTELLDLASAAESFGFAAFVDGDQLQFIHPLNFEGWTIG